MINRETNMFFVFSWFKAFIIICFDNISIPFGSQVGISLQTKDTSIFDNLVLLLLYEKQRQTSKKEQAFIVFECVKHWWFIAYNLFPLDSNQEQ